MSFPYSVHVLCGARRDEYAWAAILALKTLRVGYPTARIYLYDNGGVNSAALQDACISRKIKYLKHTRPVLHHEWIEGLLKGANSPFIISDSDVAFWEDCETLQPSLQLLSGRLIPAHLDPVTKTITVSRLHTSLLYFNDPKMLRQKLSEEVPKVLTFTPYNPIHPFVCFLNGASYFYDTCANLFHTLGGEAFTEADMLMRYDHLNCGSYMDKVLEAAPFLTGLRDAHELIKNDISNLKGFYLKQDEYYENLRPQAGHVGQ